MIIGFIATRRRGVRNGSGLGSYPSAFWPWVFESPLRHQTLFHSPVVQLDRTMASEAINAGSNPTWGTK